MHHQQRELVCPSRQQQNVTNHFVIDAFLATQRRSRFKQRRRRNCPMAMSVMRDSRLVRRAINDQVLNLLPRLSAEDQSLALPFTG